MSIPVSANAGKAGLAPDIARANRPKEDDQGGAKVKDDNPSNKVKDVESPASAVAKARANLNSAIVQTSMNVAINAGNQPLTLLFKSAINSINEELAPTLGKDAIQNAATSQDNSAEATAERILSLSTGFYDAYRQQNNLEDNAESREKFVDVIRGGFEKGFKEAQNVLSGLKVLGGDIAAGIDKTFALVMQGYDDFAAGAQSKPGGPASPV
jgi:hypothetical protein